MEEWIREIKKNRERDISRTTLEGNAHKTLSAASPHRALNVDRFWRSSRVRYAIQRATRVGLEKAVHIMAWRYIVKLIIYKYTRDRRVQEVVDDEHGLGIGADDFQDRQFAHRRRTDR